MRRFLLILDITHFGKQYTHQDSQTAIMDPWKSLNKETINGIYRHYWLDFVLLGYPIPDKLETLTS